jgi:hypothetical protein
MVFRPEAGNLKADKLERIFFIFVDDGEEFFGRCKLFVTFSLGSEPKLRQ